MKYCTELVSIHPSIEDLHRLVSMNFRGCRKLTLGLEEFPKSFHSQSISMEEMEFSEHLSATMEVILKPEPLLLIPELQPQPQVCCLRIIPLFGLTTLKALKLKGSNLKDGAIPSDISSLISLEYLDLRRNGFTSLPHSISHLPKLKYLKLDGCRKLEVLPDMPPTLLCLSAVDCSSLHRISMPHFDYETRLFLTNCWELRTVDGLQRSERRGSIHLEECNSLVAGFREFLLKDWCGHGRSSVFLPESNIPKWFHYRTRGSAPSITIPPSWYGNVKDLTICVIYSAADRWYSSCPIPNVHIHPLNVCYSAATNDKIAVTQADHMWVWVFHLPESFFLGRLDCLNELTLDADFFGVGWTVKGLGAYFPGKVWNPKDYGEVSDGEEDSEGYFRGNRMNMVKRYRLKKKMLKMIHCFQF